MVQDQFEKMTLAACCLGNGLERRAWRQGGQGRTFSPEDL